MKTVGYGWLIQNFSLKVPEPYKKSFLTTGAVRTKEITSSGEEEYFPIRYLKQCNWQEQLLFALKYEGVNLSVLKALFRELPETELVSFIQSKKTSVYLRRIWFFYEFLLEKVLPIPAVKTGNYDYVLESERYFVLDEKHSFRAQRQRLFCNLPGDARFCPIVRLTKKIKACREIDYRGRISEVLNRYPAELIYRAGQFLYLKETKSSYAIERQTPDQRRTASFMATLQEAGKQELSKELLVHLQNAIVEERYRESDYRHDQVYVGQTIAPGHELVHFAGVKPADVASFMEAFLVASRQIIDSDSHPVVAAAVLSFAFVFIHPFDDGNGRIHRYLMHHLLAAKKFCPEHIIFPVSAVLYKNRECYDRMLESFSRKLMPLVEYRLDATGVMTVQNETADYYRYINFTQIVEEIFDIIEESLQTELIPELEYLAAWDRARSLMRSVVDMPERKAMQMILFVQQNNGEFPHRRRDFFPELTDEEIAKLSEIIRTEIFSRYRNV